MSESASPDVKSAQVKPEAAATPAPQAPETAPDMTKYKIAADIVHAATKKVIELAVVGAKVIDLCIEGDKAVEAGAAAVYNKPVKGVKVQKGLAFPTSVSVNNCVAHWSPLPSDPQASLALSKGDVVKIHCGAHIDGFASVSAETIIVGATESEPATGRSADAVQAAWHAAEIAMRHIRAGEKNWPVTDIVNKATAQFNCKPVEGMLSCQFTQNSIDGKKRIILNPSEQQRRDNETATFAEGEIYGIDILVTTGDDGKARMEESRTSIYQRVHDVTYSLKMKASRATFTDVQKKAGQFPFTLRIMEDEKRARVGVQEAVQHGLLRPYEVVYTPRGTVVAQFMFTIALLPNGPSLISHPPVWYSAEKVKSEKELEDEALKELIKKPLREPKKKRTKSEGKVEVPA